MLRLIADDLTGALDTAAQFATPDAPIPVFWHPTELAGSAAWDSGTREASEAESVAQASAMAGLLTPGPGRIAFRKIDSLLRGHPGAELAACLRTLRPRYCVLAPAFPFQGRLTRAGRQQVRGAAGWDVVGEDLARGLAEAGIAPAHVRPGDTLPAGVSLWDAESDADLARIVAAARPHADEVLWCGSSGLAGALAGAPERLAAHLPRPVLGLFGSNHPATHAQLHAMPAHGLTFGGEGADATLLDARLARDGVALVRFALPAGIARAAAAASIADAMAALASRIARPASLVVSGGETLRALCLLLDASHLAVEGQIMPGIPVSTLRGGVWDGVRIVSKSGAFGAAPLLRDLLAAPPLPGGLRV